MLCVPSEMAVNAGLAGPIGKNGYPIIHIRPLSDARFSVPGEKTHTGRLIRNLFNEAGIEPESFENPSSDGSFSLCNSGFSCCFVYLSKLQKMTIPDNVRVFSVQLNATMSIACLKNAESMLVDGYIRIVKQHFGLL